jgi:hypothetical protein
MRHIRLLISFLVTLGYPCLFSYRTEQAKPTSIFATSVCSAVNTKKRVHGPGKKLQELYDHVDQEYIPAIVMIINQNSWRHGNGDALREHVLTTNDRYNTEMKKGFLKHNPYKDLPFLQYKHNLEKTTKQLDHYGQKIHNKAEYFHATVMAQLADLKKTIVTRPEYQQEQLKVAEVNESLPIKLLKSGLFSTLFKLVLPV